MQKIAILGGTFNPIHNGHLHLIKRFSEKIGFDRVILIPTKVPTHKGEEHLADAVHRVRMCRLAANSVTKSLIWKCKEKHPATQF